MSDEDPAWKYLFSFGLSSGFQFDKAYLDEFVGVNQHMPKTPFDFLGHVFLYEVNQIKRLHRGYSTHEDVLQKPRGKALISKSISNASIERRRSIYCEFQDFTEDIAINQVLKLALHEIEKKANSSSIKENASLATSLSHISLNPNFYDTKSIRPKYEEVQKINPNCKTHLTPQFLNHHENFQNL